MYYNNFSKKVKLFLCFSLFRQLLARLWLKNYVNFQSKYALCSCFQTQYVVKKLHSVYITTIIAQPLVIGKNYCFRGSFFEILVAFRSTGIDFLLLLRYILSIKAVTKTCADRKIPREGAPWVKGICTPADSDTTSEPSGGNSRLGTPIIASMSDGHCP